MPCRRLEHARNFCMRTFDTPLFMASIAIILSVGSMFEEKNDPTPGSIPMHQESNMSAIVTASRIDSTHRTHSDTTQTDSMSIGSRLTKEEVEQLTKLHNKARSDVGVGPLTWSSELAIYAQEWADRLASESCKMEHRPHSGKWLQKHGENLFIGAAGFYGVADAVKAWERERSLYKGGVINYSNCYSSGHYTQMVWSNTKHLGCAKVECDGKIIVVCNYDPPGNVIGQKPY